MPWLRSAVAAIAAACSSLAFMQVRRWFMLLRPDVRKMARAELQTNTSLDGDVAKNMKAFLVDIGLE